MARLRPQGSYRGRPISELGAVGDISGFRNTKKPTAFIDDFTAAEKSEVGRNLTTRAFERAGGRVIGEEVTFEVQN